MPNLFGVDIAQEIATAFSGLLVPGTLTKRTVGTRTPSQLTAGTQPTEVAHTFEGILEVRQVRRTDQLGSQPASVLTIIGKSMSPAADPEVGDRVLFEGLTMDISEILERDPAAATFQCLVE